MNGIVQTTVQIVHKRPLRRSRSRLTGVRHGTAASSGRAALVKRLAAGDRAPQNHQVRTERQLAHLRGGAVAVIPDFDVALSELGIEGLSRTIELDSRPGPLG